MDSIPTVWAALCGLAFALGARHGFDADHLAAIDGLARYSAASRPRLARSAGLLFSLGHGAVVLAVVAAAVQLASSWHTPHWLELTGVAVTIVFLFGLAFVNVRSVVRTAPGAVVRPAALKGRLFGRLTDVDRPWAMAGIGALFALSFDTISQASLFALAAGRERAASPMRFSSPRSSSSAWSRSTASTAPGSTTCCGGRIARPPSHRGSWRSQSRASASPSVCSRWPRYCCPPSTTGLTIEVCSSAVR
jgi:hypothetical protein